MAAAAHAVQRALAHPLFERAARQARVGVKPRFLLDLPDGRLIEGVLDSAFREVESDGPVWTVVDFKTDVEMESDARATSARWLSTPMRSLPPQASARAASCFRSEGCPSSPR